MADQFLQVGAEGSGSTTAQITLTGVTSGSTIVVFLWNGSTFSPTTHTVSDDRQGSYTAGNTAADSGDFVWAGVFYLEAASSGTHVITGTGDSGNSMRMYAVEVNGSGAGSVTDTKAAFQSGPGTSADAISSGAVTVTAASTLVSMSSDTGSTSTSNEPTANSSSTSRLNNANTDIGAYRIQTRAVSSNTAGTFTAVTGTDPYVTLAIAVKNSAGGGGTTITPSVGSLAATGNSATRIIGTVILPTVAALTLSGKNVQYQPMRLQAGSLALTGIAPTVSVTTGTTIQPAVGSLAFIGTQSVMTLTLPAPSSTALSLTGNAAVVVRGTILTPTVGSVVINGIASTLVRGTVIVPNIGALTLTGAASSLLTPITISPSTGALVLTGIAPTVNSGGSATIQPSVASLALTGIAPTVSITGSFTIQPTATTLAFTGTSAVPVRGINILPSVGSLAFTGIAPSLLRTSVIAPNVGALAIVGNSPTLTQTGNAIIVTGVGSLVLTGKQASVPSGFLPPISAKTVKISWSTPTVKVRA